MLLRVPGIGVKSAKRIYYSRKVHVLKFEDLKKLGVVLKRTQYFITCSGKYYGDVAFKEHLIEKRLMPQSDLKLIQNNAYEQMSFYNSLPSIVKR